MYPSPLGKTEEFDEVPTCPKCDALCRPHILLFDESYNEEFYRMKTAQTMFEAADVMIILGTQLKTNLPKRLADMACKQKKLILECNIEPVLEYGKVMINKKPVIQSFPAIVDTIINN